jgi:hypothetical protein
LYCIFLLHLYSALSILNDLMTLHVQPVSYRLVVFSFCVVLARLPLDGAGGLVKLDSSFFFFACCRPVRSQVNVLRVPLCELLSCVCVLPYSGVLCLC